MPARDIQEIVKDQIFLEQDDKGRIAILDNYFRKYVNAFPQYEQEAIEERALVFQDFVQSAIKRSESRVGVHSEQYPNISFDIPEEAGKDAESLQEAISDRNETILKVRQEENRLRVADYNEGDPDTETPSPEEIAAISYDKRRASKILERIESGEDKSDTFKNPETIARLRELRDAPIGGKTRSTELSPNKADSLFRNIHNVNDYIEFLDEEVDPSNYEWKDYNPESFPGLQHRKSLSVKGGFELRAPAKDGSTVTLKSDQNKPFVTENVQELVRNNIDEFGYDYKWVRDFGNTAASGLVKGFENSARSLEILKNTIKTPMLYAQLKAGLIDDVAFEERLVEYTDEESRNLLTGILEGRKEALSKKEKIARFSNADPLFGVLQRGMFTEELGELVGDAITGRAGYGITRTGTRFLTRKLSDEIGKKIAVKGAAASIGAKNYLTILNDAVGSARAEGEDRNMSLLYGLWEATTQTPVETFADIKLIKSAARLQKADAIKAGFGPFIKGKFKAAMENALREGTTEAVQNVLSNSVRSIYDPERAISEGLTESVLAGMLLGASIGGTLGDRKTKEARDEDKFLDELSKKVIEREEVFEEIKDKKAAESFISDDGTTGTFRNPKTASAFFNGIKNNIREMVTTTNEDGSITATIYKRKKKDKEDLKPIWVHDGKTKVGPKGKSKHEVTEKKEKKAKKKASAEPKEQEKAEDDVEQQLNENEVNDLGEEDPDLDSPPESDPVEPETEEPSATQEIDDILGPVPETPRRRGQTVEIPTEFELVGEPTLTSPARPQEQLLSLPAPVEAQQDPGLEFNQEDDLVDDIEDEVEDDIEEEDEITELPPAESRQVETKQLQFPSGETAIFTRLSGDSKWSLADIEVPIGKSDRESRLDIQDVLADDPDFIKRHLNEDEDTEAEEEIAEEPQDEQPSPEADQNDTASSPETQSEIPEAEAQQSEAPSTPTEPTQDLEPEPEPETTEDESSDSPLDLGDILGGGPNKKYLMDNMGDTAKEYTDEYDRGWRMADSGQDKPEGETVAFYEGYSDNDDGLNKWNTPYTNLLTNRVYEGEDGWSGPKRKRPEQNAEEPQDFEEEPTEEPQTSAFEERTRVKVTPLGDGRTALAIAFAGRDRVNSQSDLKVFLEMMFKDDQGNLSDEVLIARTGNDTVEARIATNDGGDVTIPFKVVNGKSGINFITDQAPSQLIDEVSDGSIGNRAGDQFSNNPIKGDKADALTGIPGVTVESKDTDDPFWPQVQFANNGNLNIRLVSSADSNDKELTNDEEIDHALLLVGLRDKWEKGGKKETFRNYVENHAKNSLLDIEIKTKGANSITRKRILNHLDAAIRVYDRNIQGRKSDLDYQKFRDELKKNSPEAIDAFMAFIRNGVMFRRGAADVKFYFEVIRQLSQIERLETTTEFQSDVVRDIINGFKRIVTDLLDAMKFGYKFLSEIPSVKRDLDLVNSLRDRYVFEVADIIDNAAQGSPIQLNEDVESLASNTGNVGISNENLLNRQNDNASDRSQEFESLGSRAGKPSDASGKKKKRKKRKPPTPEQIKRRELDKLDGTLAAAEFNGLSELMNDRLVGDDLNDFSEGMTIMRTMTEDDDLADIVKAQKALAKSVKEGTSLGVNDYMRDWNAKRAAAELKSIVDEVGKDKAFGAAQRNVSLFFSKAFYNARQKQDKIAFHPKVKRWARRNMRYINESFDNYDRAVRNDISQFTEIVDKHRIKPTDMDQMVRLELASIMTQYSKDKKSLSKNETDMMKSIEVHLTDSDPKQQELGKLTQKYLKEIQSAMDLSDDKAIESNVNKIEALLLNNREKDFLDDMRNMFAEKKKELFSVADSVYGSKLKEFNNYMRKSVRFVTGSSEYKVNETRDLKDTGSFDIESAKGVDGESSVLEERTGLGDKAHYNMDFFSKAADALRQTEYEIHTARDRAQMEALRDNRQLNEFTRDSDIKNGRTFAEEMYDIAKQVHTAEVKSPNIDKYVGFVLEAINMIKITKVSDISKYASQMIPYVHGMSSLDKNGREVMLSRISRKGQDEWLKNNMPRIYERSKTNADLTANFQRRLSRGSTVGKAREGLEAVVRNSNALPDAISASNVAMGKYGELAIKNGLFKDAADFNKRFRTTPPNQVLLNEAQQFSEKISASTISRSLKASIFRPQGASGRLLVDTFLPFSQTVSTLAADLAISTRNAAFGLASSDPELRAQAREGLEMMASIGIVQLAGFVIIDNAVKAMVLGLKVGLVRAFKDLFGEEEEGLGEYIDEQLKRSRSRSFGMFDELGFQESPRLINNLVTTGSTISGPLMIMGAGNAIIKNTIKNYERLTGNAQYGRQEIADIIAELEAERKAEVNRLKFHGMDIEPEQLVELTERIEDFKDLKKEDPATYRGDSNGVTGMLLDSILSFSDNPVKAAREFIPGGFDAANKVLEKARTNFEEDNAKKLKENIERRRKELLGAAS